MSGAPKVVFDVSALFEETWTGIPNMVAAIARRALTDDSIDWLFTYDTTPISRSLVERFLKQHSGVGGLAALAELVWRQPALTRTAAESMIALFPNIKPVRRMFRKELSIICDLSPVVTPQFHNDINISHFADRIRDDIDSSDHIFCISRATLGDVQSYFGKPANQMSVIRLGAEFDPANLSAALLYQQNLTAEPYVAVIGTLEPRKNGGIIFDYLVQNPGFASAFRIVFVGRDGWLDERARLLTLLEASGVGADRVLFTGYLNEAEKVALVLNSAFCVYPSFYEGFGLPVLEAGALGKVTVCSNSSSMPEVFPDSCVFFNPADVFEFGQALHIAELRAAQTRSSRQSLSDLLERTRPHSWDRCYATVAQRLTEI